MLQKQRHELPLRGEGGHSSELEKMYYSQLSKTQVNVKLHSLSLNQKSLSSLAKQNSMRNYFQVWQLFLLYRVDHELFGFSPRRYLEWAEK